MNTECKTVPLQLALRRKEAARALGISERLLWSKTVAGEVPHVRLGRAVIYPVDCLREWLAKNTQSHHDDMLRGR